MKWTVAKIIDLGKLVFLDDKVAIIESYSMVPLLSSMFVHIKKEGPASQHPPPLYKSSQILLPEVCLDKDRQT